MNKLDLIEYLIEESRRQNTVTDADGIKEIEEDINSVKDEIRQLGER